MTVLLRNADIAAIRGKDDAPQAEMRQQSKPARFLLVACLVSVILRSLDQYMFGEEDWGLCEICALVAFATGMAFRQRWLSGGYKFPLLTKASMNGLPGHMTPPRPPQQRRS